MCQLSYLYHTFCQAIDHSKEIRVLFCDIKVRHFIGYVTKESYLNYTLVLVQVYLIGLKISCMTVNNVFCLNGVYSNTVTMEAGVPQGSILGPFLFLIYNNDIVSDITSNVKIFADDTSLSMVVENPILTADILNDDLQTINYGANKWLVTFKSAKTESMLISKK